MRLLLAVAVLLTVAVAAPATSPAAGARWRSCDKAHGRAAAKDAGLPALMNADRRLRRVFGDERPSEVLTYVVTSLCADYDRDRDRDRLVRFACCTVSTPSPFAVLENTRRGYRVAYKRLHDTVFKILRAGRDVIEREPVYSPSDANCCPSHLRLRRIHFTGKRFRATSRVVAARR